MVLKVSTRESTRVIARTPTYQKMSIPQKRYLMRRSNRLKTLQAIADRFDIDRPY